MPLPTTPPTTPPTTMPLPTTPPVPNVAPKNIAATSPRFFAIRITWNRIPPEKSVAGISYVVFVRKLELTAWKKLAILSSEVQSYTHQKVEENYHVYKVCGATGGGYGPNSTEVTARPSSPSKGAVIFKAGYRGGRILAGYQTFWSRFIAVSNTLAKLHKS